jgi:8-oxo-dGTP diphosphatase
MENSIRVGIGVLVFKDGKILLSKRKGAHGAGEYAFPGGHLEYMESFAECARREVKEETGMEIDDIKFQFVGNVKDYAPRHYVHIGLTSEWKSGEPKVMEPDKSESWDWYDLENLPEPLFAPCVLQIEVLKTKQNYFDC